MICKLTLKEGKDGGDLGFKWIEVLAVSPCLLTPISGAVKHGAMRVVNEYLCNTEYGLVQIPEADLFTGDDFINEHYEVTTGSAGK